MLVRDISGRLHIVSRKECKNDADYYQKLVKIRSEYIQHYKSVIHISQCQHKPIELSKPK
jgi:hypothetical protein